MRRYKVTIIAIAAVLSGCHSPSASKAPADAAALLQDIQTKFAAVPAQPTGTHFDLRKDEDSKALKAALAPLNLALDEAKQLLDFRSYPIEIMPAGDFSPGPVVIGSKHDLALKQAAFLKRFVRALCARARLEYTNGKTAAGLMDLKIAVQTVNLVSVKEGSMLALLVNLACESIVLRMIQELTLDTSLESNQYADLGALTESISSPGSFVEMIRMERKSDLTSKEPNHARDLAVDDNVLAVFSKNENDPSKLLIRLKSLCTSGQIPTTADEITNASKTDVASLIFAGYLALLRVEADTRMTVAFNRALAEQDKNGHFPTSLPNLGKDPFSGGSLVYKRTKDGFSISAPGSRGYVVTPSRGDFYTLSYPLSPYLPALL